MAARQVEGNKSQVGQKKKEKKGKKRRAGAITEGK